MIEEVTCRELVEIVTDYFEGQLSAAGRIRFEQHLANCPGCEAYVDQMRRTIELTGTLRVEDVPAEAEEALLQAFRGWKRT
jgi:anti-sigma factor RsiW